MTTRAEPAKELVEAYVQASIDHILNRNTGWEKERDACYAAIDALAAEPVALSEPVTWVADWAYEHMVGGSAHKGPVEHWPNPKDKTGLTPLYATPQPSTSTAMDALRELVDVKNIAEEVDRLESEAVSPNEWDRFNSLEDDLIKREPLAWAAARAALKK